MVTKVLVITRFQCIGILNTSKIEGIQILCYLPEWRIIISDNVLIHISKVYRMVVFSAESYQHLIIENIRTKGVDGGQGRIETQVKLFAIDEVWVGDVLLDEGIFGFEV